VERRRSERHAAVFVLVLSLLGFALLASARKVLTRYLFFTVKDKKPKKPAGAVPQPTDDACPKKKKEKKTTGKKKKVQKRIN
jgi:hypothetical protein